MELKKNVILLSARNFGDAIIANTVAKNIGRNNLYNVSVITKKEYKEIFEANAYIKKCYYTSLPIASNKSYDIVDFFKSIKTIRTEQFDIGLDLMGDFRERIILKFINPKEIFSLERMGDNPYNNLIRKGMGNICKKINVPENVVNVYESMQYLYKEMKVDEVLDERQYLENNTIGIHPFASQECRMWPWEYWEEIIDNLLANKYKIKLFCTRKERDILQSNISEYKKCCIVSGGLQFFFENMKTCNMVVCLDSFAYHAAYSLGVPTLMLNGANDYRIWKTPNSYVLLSETKCPYWPCFNKPVCKNYDCIHDIKPKEVMKAIKRMMGRNNNEF